METTRIWDSRNNRHATVEHETWRPCPFCGGTPRIDPAMGSTGEIMDSLWVRARLAARNNRPLIRAVAARLDHYGFWTGEDIRRIIDECEKELGQ